MVGSDALFLEYPQRCKPKRRVTDSDQQDPKRCKYHLPKNIYRNTSDKEKRRGNDADNSKKNQVMEKKLILNLMEIRLIPLKPNQFKESSILQS